jgi:hypothetical protein
MAVPLSNPAMAAAAKTFLDTFFILRAISNRRTYGTQPWACSSINFPS